MSINYAELEKVVEELKDFIIDSVIKKITQYNKNALTIEFRKQNKDLEILFYLDAKNTFLGQCRFWEEAPKNPYHFTVLARKYILGKTVKDFYSEKNDRILHIIFDDCRIIAELLGKNGNIFLLDNSNKIISVLRNRTGEKRVEKAGQEYKSLGSTTQKEFSIRQIFIQKNDLSLLNQITDFYLKKIAKEKLEDEIKSIENEIKRKKDYLESLIDEYENSDEKIYKETADLIMQNLNNFENVKDKIKLTIIADKSLVENAQYFYSLYKKYSRKKIQLSEYIKTIEENISKFEEKIENLKNLAFKLENGQIEAFNILRHKNEAKAKEKSEIKRESNPLYCLITLENGKKIVYGKSAAGNNEILKKFGKGNFWWFHVRDYQGPFVIILDENLTNEDIKIASTIALHFSKGKNAGKASVIYTRVKYVKPIPKIPGKVNYTKEKEYFASIDNELIKKILAEPI